MELISFLPAQKTQVDWVDDDTYITSIGCNLAIAKFSNSSNFQLLGGHSQSISCFAVSKDKKYVASGQSGEENTKETSTPVILWDLKSREQILVLRGHQGKITGICFSEDSRIIAVIDDQSKRVWIWDVNEHDLGIVIPLKDVPSNIAITRKNENVWDLVVIVRNHLFKFNIVFDPRTFEFRQTSHSFANPQNGYYRDYTVCAADSPCFVAASVSGDVSIYNVDSCTIRAISAVDGLPVGAVCFTDNSNSLLIGGENLSLIEGDDTVWQIKKYVKLSGSVISIAFYHQKALVKTDDTTIYVVDVPSLRARKILVGSHFAPLCLAISGDVVAMALGEGGFGTCKIGSSLCFDSYSPEHPSMCVCASENRTFFAGLSNGRIACFAINGMHLWTTDLIHRGPVTAIASTKDFIATGGDDGMIRVVTHQSRSLVNDIRVHSGRIREIIPAFGHEKRVHSVSDDRTLTTTDVATGKRISQQLAEGRIGFRSIQQLKDGETEVLVGMGDGEVRGYDWPKKGVVLSERTPDGLQINAIALNPKKRLLACGGEHEYISLCDLNSSSWTVSGPGHSTSLYSMVWSEDGKYLISGGNDGLGLWNVK